jgi:2-dehydro-3-deoxyphosphogluconate aldolase/(4S)-4-hydroxy-2-oxoglutarate aldolase
MTPEIRQKIKEAGVIAVLIIDDAQQAVPLAKSLLAGGITAMELTLRTPAALDALKAIVREVPQMLAGIGTILTTSQVDAAADAGAAFGVAPGCNPRIIAHAQKRGLPFGPGIATPSDIEIALENGCTLLKYFPAETLGGLKHLKNMAAPYQHLKVEYIPLGGVSTANAETYLKDPLIAAIGGSWLAPREAIKNGDWALIEKNAREAAELARKSRS